MNLIFFLNKLKKNNLNIFQFKDTNKPITPDSIFPNNWISTYQNNIIIIHSMFAKNRRLERRSDIIDFFKKNFFVEKVYNNSEELEKKNKFLEGTGSMVLDRVNKVIERKNENGKLVFAYFADVVMGQNPLKIKHL